jgi:queuine/archaeosine tRNA-ribosyltransferase
MGLSTNVGSKPTPTVQPVKENKRMATRQMSQKLLRLVENMLPRTPSNCPHYLLGVIGVALFSGTKH